MNAAANKTDALNLDARAAHVAIARQVELQGHDMARALYAAAREYNALFFGGALLPSFVEITPAGSLRALADYRPRSMEGVESHVRVGHKALKKGGRFVLDCLLHELVHAYQHEILEDLEPGYRGHGPKFTAECNRIGALLGLPPVYTKGRGGPNCATWPMCVRPAGYYGEEPAGEGDAGKSGEGSEPAKKTRKEETAIEKIARLLARADRATLRAVHELTGDLLSELGEE